MKSYDIKLTEQQLSIVGQALQEMPYRLSAQVIAEIHKQAQAQDQKPTIPADLQPQ